MLAANRRKPSGRRGEYQTVRFGSGAGPRFLSDRLGHPRRIAGEQFVIFGRPQKSDDAQLDDEVVDHLLRLGLGDEARRQIPFDVDVEKRGRPAQRHRRAVLLLDAGEIAEVQPLHGLAGRRRRFRDVEAVAGGHLPQLFERADLFRQLFAVADDVVGRHLAVQIALLFLLALDEPLDAVERDPAVVADDPATAVGVGKTRQDVRLATAPDVVGIGVEHAVVVGPAIFAEDLHDARVRLPAVRLQRGDDHPEPAVRHDGPLQRRLRLEADDDLVFTIDIAGSVRRDGRWDLRHVEHAFATFLDEQILERLP